MIKLTDGFFITADERNFMLRQEQTASKDGKKKESVVLGYYMNLSDCLAGFYKVLTRRLTTKEDMTLQQAILEFRRIEEDIRRLASGEDDF